MTQIIDGKALAASIRADLAKRTTVLTEKGHRPGLAVVIVGDDPASQVYVRNKIRAFTGGPARLKAAFFRGACASISRA